MLYYLGTGTEFKKEDCKEYKTLEGVLKAAAKSREFVVWDENGQVVNLLTDNVSDITLQTNPDGNVPTFDSDGNLTGTVNSATVAAGTESVLCGDENGQTALENSKNAADSVLNEKDTVIVPQGKMKVTVICDGTLNLRRSPAWGNENICGRASRGQTYYVKEIYEVDGKKIVRTVGDIYLSGDSAHVQFEQL